MLLEASARRPWASDVSRVYGGPMCIDRADTVLAVMAYTNFGLHRTQTNGALRASGNPSRNQYDQKTGDCNWRAQGAFS